MAILFSGAPVSGGGGGGGTDITAFQLLTTDATNIAANSHFEFGVPLAPGVVDGTKLLQVVDTGNNVIGYAQEDNRGTDLSSSVRIAKFTGTIISAPGATNKAVKLQYLTGSPVTSNPVTVANLLAQDFSGDTFEIKITCTFPNGDVYTCLATDALNASSSWTYGSPQNRGTFRSGPLCTEWECSAPLVRLGTPHPFLNAQFEISAYKDNPGAWNNITNPITSVKVIFKLENGFSDVASPRNLVYDLLVQKGASALTTAYQLNGSSPSATLTLSGGTGPVFANRSAGVWAASSTTTPNAQDTGKAIVEVGGNGRGWLSGLTSTTQSYAYIAADDPFSGTTFTSGQWRTMGVYHSYARRIDNYMFPIFMGTAQNVVAALPTSFYKTSQLVLNYASNKTSAGDPDLSFCNADGAHPGAIRLSNNSVKNCALQETAGGDADHIGVLSYSFCVGLMNLTYSDGQYLNARSLILQNSTVGSAKPFFVRSSQHGGTIAIDEAGVYVWSGVGSPGPSISLDSYGNGTTWYGFATNHSPGCSLLAYLLTGDLYHLENSAVAGNDYSLRIQDSGVIATTVCTLNAASASVTMPSGYPQQDGEAFVLEWTGGTPQIASSNVNRNNIFYLKRIDATHANFYDTHANAVAGGATGKVTFTGAGSGTFIRNGYGKSSLPAIASDAQPRTVAWNWRTIAQELMVWPDTMTPGLVDYSRTRANLQRQLNAMGLYLKNFYADDVNYQAGGPRYLTLHSSGGNNNLYATWQNNYIRLAGCNGQEAGVHDANSQAFHDWFLADSIQWIARTSDSSPLFMPNTYYVRAADNAGTPQYTYAGIYQQAMLSPIAVSQSCLWSQSGQSATISSITGATVSVALAQNFFDVSNPSRHIGSWFLIGNGAIQVTNVVDAKHFDGDITVTTWDGMTSGVPKFSSASYDNATGVVTLNLTQAALGIGDKIAVVGATGTGSVSSINGNFTVTGSFLGGTQITYSIASGLTMTITGAGLSRLVVGSGQTTFLPYPSFSNAVAVTGTDENYGFSGGQPDKHYTWLANSGKEIAYQRGIDTANYATAVAQMATLALPSNPPSNAVVMGCGSALKANVVHR